MIGTLQEIRLVSSVKGVVSHLLLQKPLRLLGGIYGLQEMITHDTATTLKCRVWVTVTLDKSKACEDNKLMVLTFTYIHVTYSRKVLFIS